MHYCFIVNNEPSKARNAQMIEEQLNKLETKPDFEIYKTTAERAATQFVRDFCK